MTITPMIPLRFRKLYSKDVSGNLVQNNFSQYTRIAQVIYVDTENGTCTVKWLDRPGIRINVILTQSSPGTWEIPKRNSIVLISFDPYERARIIRYINLGQKSRISQIKNLPKFKEGEKLWEGGNGSYLYLKATGDIILSTSDQGYFLLEKSTGTAKSETVNWKAITNAGTMYLGLIKRFLSNGDGTNSIKTVTDSVGSSLTEYRLKMVELADGTLGLKGISSPLLDIACGTYVDDAGTVVNKKGSDSKAIRTKQLALHITLDSGTVINVDKEGRVSIKATSINWNEGNVDTTDPDVALGLETADASLGTKGQHVAREHDLVTTPISAVYVDEAHLDLQKNISPPNLKVLQALAVAFISPTGPCLFTPAAIPPNTALQGLITEGATNLYAGDK